MTTLGLAPKEESIQIHAVDRGGDFHQALLAVPEQQDWKPEWVFRQKPRWGRPERQLTLFNGRYLEWREKQGRKESVRVLNLAFVNPEPHLQRVLAWRSLVILLLSSLLAGLAWHLVWMPGQLAGGLLAVLSALHALRHSSTSFLFVTRHGRVPVIELYRQRQDRARMNKVLEVVRIRGLKAWKLLPKGKQRLAAEVAEHRRLVESGSLTEGAYRDAKRRIFSTYSASPGPGEASG